MLSFAVVSVLGAVCCFLSFLDEYIGHKRQINDEPGLADVLYANATTGALTSILVTDGQTLYVFLDESGDMVYTEKGSDHFVLSAVYTDSPCHSAAPRQDLKYELLRAGSLDLEFHATDNSKGTRKRVCEVIRTLPDIKVHTLWIDKRYTAPTLQDPVALFSLFGKAMGRWIATVVTNDHDQVVMVFDSVLTAKQQDAFKAAVNLSRT
jgi:hypothetical protein